MIPEAKHRDKSEDDSNQSGRPIPPPDNGDKGDGKHGKGNK
jgi:hypothetical protein